MIHLESAVILRALILAIAVTFCINTLEAQIETVLLDSLVMNLEDSLGNRKLTINGYPYAFSSPETNLAFGAGGIIIFYTEKDIKILPSKIGFGGYYSINGQYKISLNPAFYFLENKLFVKVPMSYGKFIDKFWGFGNDTGETGNESYTRQGLSVTFVLQSPPVLFSADRSGLIIDFDDTEITDKMDNSFLLDDEVVGSNGGQSIGFGYDLTWDSRDNIFFPNSGGYQYFKIVVYPELGDFFYAQLELDVKHFESFSPDHVLGFNFYLSSVMGDAPFYKYPALGGAKRMRGYFTGRYRDKFYSAIQMEYRQYFWRKFGFVVFGGLGDVAPEFIKFDFTELKYSYGMGLRFLFNKKQKINLRMDFGFGQDGNSGVYFGIEEAF